MNLGDLKLADVKMWYEALVGGPVNKQLYILLFRN